jgi:hypothetical protein
VSCQSDVIRTSGAKVPSTPTSRSIDPSRNAHVSLSGFGAKRRTTFEAAALITATRRAALAVVGPERLMFSTDFPYQYRPGGDARRFLQTCGLDETAKAAYTHENWRILRRGSLAHHLPSPPALERTESGLQANSNAGSFNAIGRERTLSFCREPGIRLCAHFGWFGGGPASLKKTVAAKIASRASDG